MAERAICLSVFWSLPVYLPIDLCSLSTQAGIDGVWRWNRLQVDTQRDREKELLVSVNERAHVYIHVTACQFKYHRIEGVCVCVCESVSG